MRLPGTHIAACILAAGLVAFTAPGVQAQSNEFRSLLDRIERLQRDLATLQRHVYRGEPAPAAESIPQSAASAELSGTQAARIELRLSQFETQLRELTGQIEEQAYRFNQMSGKLEQLAADMELRLQAIESGAPAGTPTGGPAAETPGASATPGVIGTISEADLAASQTASLPGGTPQQQYDHAFALLSKTQYDEASEAFSTFLDQHAEHELAGNAKYWLGESYYVQGQYTEAAVTFAEGFQDYPDSIKAPDNLLKLGKSLAALGQNDDACGTYAELIKRYSSATPTILKQAKAERQRLSCP